MGRRIRAWKPNTVYSMVISCVDRQFLLKPDHHPRHPLLAAGCSPTSLDPKTELLPLPSTINIIGAAVARAQQLFPLRVHWVEANINHFQVGFSAAADQVGHISDFLKAADSVIATRINAKWEREGHMWGAVCRVTPCTDDQGAGQQLVYAMTNAVKDGLAERVLGGPFFTSYRALGQGKVQRYWQIDWEAYDLAGGKRKKSHCPKEYMSWLELKLEPLPEQAEWAEHQRQSWVRAQVRAVEEAVGKELRKSGRRAMGLAKLMGVDPRSRPASPRKGGPQPSCHSGSEKARREWEKEWGELRRAHRAASIEYRQGNWEREFPEGTFRPPLSKPYTSSRL